MPRPTPSSREFLSAQDPRSSRTRSRPRWTRAVQSTAWLAIGVFCLAGQASAQRNLSNIPSPDAEEERASFQVVEGFDVNLFVGDPAIAKPIHMNFDADGRLWIASSEVYPHIKPGEPATDKILVVEDTDGDGVVDKSTVFAEGLLIPTGIAPGDGGCYVANSTELIHLADTDGDGKADQRRVILSGFGTEDTHHLLHSLRWGPDGCLYMNQSIYIHSHIETPYGVRRMNGGGIWRFRPETMELEVVCLGFVNPWGHHFDYWGQSFATDGAYGEGINYVFPGSVFVTSPGATRIMHGLNPGSPKHCGLEILSGRHLPDSWRGSMVTNDFRANRVCRFVVTDDRSAYQSRQETELIRTNHVAFRPIDAKMGPDGAIYIADWYNPIIQHGEVDFRDDRRDHVHGRIWRITAQGRETLKHPVITGAPIEELLELLRVPEDWVRLHAKLELKSRGAVEVVPALQAWIAALDPADSQFEHDRVEALWVYQNLNLPNTDLLMAVAASPVGEARAAAIRVAVDWRDALADRGAALFEKAVGDEHPRVRLEGVRALSTLGSARAAEQATRVLDAPMDDFLDFALWKTLRELSGVWVPELLEGRLHFGGNVDHLTYALKAVDAPAVMEPLLKIAADESLPQETRANVLVLAASQADGAGLDQVLTLLGQVVPDSRQQLDWIETMARSTSQRRVAPASGSDLVLAALANTNEPSTAALRIAG
ncbi:MAG: sorbosone dehydrogenase, partial [Planctomycetales bacterium]|nr:sorbosone dehydrogenase [Planctomycetales bacterium]